ncbi:hypothetical protein EBR21_02520, partial [bacterium]|nr:hypothetical protein [bacterium]
RAMPKDTGSVNEPLQPIPGTPPDLFAPPPGCAFAARCSAALAVCHRRQPSELATAGNRASCWLHHKDAAQYRAAAGITSFASEQISEVRQ